MAAIVTAPAGLRQPASGTVRTLCEHFLPKCRSFMLPCVHDEDRIRRLLRFDRGLAPRHGSERGRREGALPISACKPLKKLDSEKEMKGNERKFAVQTALQAASVRFAEWSCKLPEASFGPHPSNGRKLKAIDPLAFSRVMAGLDPAIHAVVLQKVRLVARYRCRGSRRGTTWMAGSSPAMTFPLCREFARPARRASGRFASG